MTLDTILKQTAKYTGITIEQMQGRSREREICDARHLYCYTCKYFQSSLKDHYTLEKVGKKINRGHSVVLHSIRLYSDLMDSSSAILKDFEAFKDSFRQKWWVTKITKEEADRIIRRSIGSYEIVDS